MNIGNLEFKPVKDIYNLISNNTLLLINELKISDDIFVAQILPDFADGFKLCEKYNINPRLGINCLIVEAKRGDIIKYAALLVPIGYKYNMSSVVRKELNARSVSVANLDYVLKNTEMEYGSINPIGIPNDWSIFIDPKVLENDMIIIGGGLKISKMLIPSNLLLKLPNAKILENLAKED